MEEREVNRRFLFYVTTIVYLIIISFAFRFQVIEGRKYYRLSETNRIKEVMIKPPRGQILDRNGKVLATIRPGHEIKVLPAVIDRKTIELLADIIHKPPSEITAKIKECSNPYQAITLGHDIDFVTLCRLEEQLGSLKGVDIVTEPLRYYPYHRLFFHVVGFVGETSPEELNKGGYKPGDLIGKTGIEARFERELKGKKGVRYIEIDAHGKEIGLVEEKRPIPPQPGMDIKTTLDAELQESTALYLNGYPRAAVVGMDLRSGEVLILYSKPGIDPNIIVHGMKKNVWDSISRHPAAPLFNRTTLSRYPPGSTFKVLTAIAALISGWDTTRKISCTKRYRFGNRVFRCWRRHGRVRFIEAIEKSCDTYFYEIGKTLGLDPLLRVKDLLQFEEKTGIEIEEEESFFPDTSWYERKYGSQWPRGVILNLVIGQGEVLLTPIRLATIYAEILTGKKITPHLVKKKRPKSEPLPIDNEILKLIHQGLKRVVEEGTGRIVTYYLKDAGGKTGTAQNPHGEDHSLFIGFTPADNPRFLVCVVIENAGHGASAAAPVAGKILSLYKKRYVQKT